MIKEIFLDGHSHKMEITWTGSKYAIAIDDKAFQAIPMDAIKDIEALKPYILKAIENKHDLTAIEKWDGDLN